MAWILLSEQINLVLDNKNWDAFANCKYDPNAKKWEMIKRPIIRIYKEAGDHELLGG